jgi:hypothetical protein
MATVLYQVFDQNDNLESSREEQVPSELTEDQAITYGMGMMFADDWCPGGSDNKAQIFWNDQLIWENEI